MGLYYIARSGKGICLGYDANVRFDVDELAKYIPAREDVEKSVIDPRVPEISDDLLAKRKDWPVLWRLASLDYRLEWFLRGECEPVDWVDEDAKYVLSNTMHFCFEKKYGYPYNSFTSVSDYNGNFMIFCNVIWPSTEYDKALSEITEEKLEAQLKEFLSEVTIDMKLDNRKLEICKEYRKD